MKPSGTQIASPSEGVKRNIIRKLRKKKKELGKSPSERNVNNQLIYAARKRIEELKRMKEIANDKKFGEKSKEIQKGLSIDRGEEPSTNEERGC